MTTALQETVMDNHPQPARWPRLLSEAAAAEYFSISVSTLRSMKLDIVRIGRRVLYDRFAMDAWVEQNNDPYGGPMEFA
jgi:hypothetical protein